MYQARKQCQRVKCQWGIVTLLFDRVIAVCPQRSYTLMVPQGLHKTDQPITKNSLIQ